MPVQRGSELLVEPGRRATPRGYRWPARPPARTRPGSNAPARDRSWSGCGVASPRGARQSPAPGSPVTSASSSSPSSEWTFVRNSADPASAAVVVQPLGEALGLAQALQHPPEFAELDQHCTVARGESRRPAPAWTGSPAAPRGHPAPARTSPAPPGAPTARPPCFRPAGDSAPPSPAARPAGRDGRAARCVRRADPGESFRSRRRSARAARGGAPAGAPRTRPRE